MIGHKQPIECYECVTFVSCRIFWMP